MSLRKMIRRKVQAHLASFFDLLVQVAIDHYVWEATEDLAWQLDRQEKILPLTDIIIAACALRVCATILTSDRHFEMVPRLQVKSW